MGGGWRLIVFAGSERSQTEGGCRNGNDGDDGTVPLFGALFFLFVCERNIVLSLLCHNFLLHSRICRAKKKRGSNRRHALHIVSPIVATQFRFFVPYYPTYTQIKYEWEIRDADNRLSFSNPKKKRLPRRTAEKQACFYL